MVADIVPVLAAITGLDQAAANEEFAAAWLAAKEMDIEEPSTQTFVRAVEVFMEKNPFNIGDLAAAWKVRDEIENRRNRPTA